MNDTVPQIDGISWMVHMFKNGMPMILGDQMGLGKTIQSIGFLAYLHHYLKQPGPHLVVAPLSVLSNWIAEFERFCPSFRTVRFHGLYYISSSGILFGLLMNELYMFLLVC